MEERVIHIQRKVGTESMDLEAPNPTGQVYQPKAAPVDLEVESSTYNTKNPSAVAVTVAGCGGAGINLSRHLSTDDRILPVKYFDTSMVNSRYTEAVNIIANGSGSGSDRAANARDIERAIPMLTDEEIGLADVAIVIHSLGGGSGSVIAPLLMREYTRRGMRVIGVAISDTSSSVSAKNTLNTLKTLTAITKHNEMYLPMIILQNDKANTRGAVDDSARALVNDLINILTSAVYEVDRNDRLNWIAPMKVVNTTPGVKLMTFSSVDSKVDDKLVLGTDSKEMVDSLMILTSSPDDEIKAQLPPARLKKLGFYNKNAKQLIGKVSSDISSVEAIIDLVDKQNQLEAAQRHRSVDRLSTSGSDELIL